MSILPSGQDRLHEQKVKAYKEAIHEMTENWTRYVTSTNLAPMKDEILKLMRETDHHKEYEPLSKDLNHLEGLTLNEVNQKCARVVRLHVMALVRACGQAAGLLK